MARVKLISAIAFTFINSISSEMPILPDSSFVECSFRAPSETTAGTFILKSPWRPRAEVIGDSERFTLLAGTLKKGGKAASGIPRLVLLGKGCRIICRSWYLRNHLPVEVTGESSWK